MEHAATATAPPGLMSYWNLPAETVMALLGSDPQGLDPEAAARRLRETGPNVIGGTDGTGALRLLLRQFESPLVLILVFAATVSLVLREWVDASIILLIVLGSSLLSFMQEYRASEAVRGLKQRLELMVRARRAGAVMAVPFATVVPGDIVLLSAGNMIPADGLVLEAADFLVSEASMTGESFPVEKRPGIVAADAPVAARTNAVFLGASVRSGTATVLAVRTGRQTGFGAIAARLAAQEAETGFARGVRSFGYLLIRVMIVIVLFVLTVNLMLGRPLLDALLFAVALAVGMSPELLPAITSVTLAAGARAMAAGGVIVRQLEAIENLGSMDVLCTDKTGTLTTGDIVLDAALGPEGEPSPHVLKLAFLNAALETGIGNPLDTAIVAAGERAGLTAAGFTKVDEIPYDFQRRRLTIVAATDPSDPSQLMVTKGAFEGVLDACTQVQGPSGPVPLDHAMRARLSGQFEAKGREGLRVLALATRHVPARLHHAREDEREMTFEGFLVFSDPPRADAGATIRDLAGLGIAIKVISGDNRHVTAHLASAVGLDPSSMLTGAQLQVMKDEALWNLAPRTSLFVEIDPQQKERIVRALQHMGHTVGYLGDGINDAPALHAADVGISVDTAVDVARESADLILLSRSLDVLRQGVMDGRRTFINTLKYISITTSANFGNMVSMALVSPLLPFLPLAAKQILLNNFLSDIPSMAISGDNADAEQWARPQGWSIRQIQSFMIVFGLVSSVFDMITFAVLLLAFRASEAEFQSAWFVISLLTELAVVLVLRTRRPALQSRPGRILLWLTLAIGTLAPLIPALPVIGGAFGFVPLPWAMSAASFLIVAGYILATEWVKAWFWRAAA